MCERCCAAHEIEASILAGRKRRARARNGYRRHHGRFTMLVPPSPQDGLLEVSDLETGPVVLVLGKFDSSYRDDSIINRLTIYAINTGVISRFVTLLQARSII